MMPKSRVLLACILALLTAGEPAWGQAPPHFKNETDVETWLNNVPAFASVKEVLVCIDNKLFRAVLIFRPYLLFEPVNLAGRPNPCDPSNDDNEIGRAHV